MATKGSIAKDNLINKIIKDNKDTYIGCVDKKYYFWAEENGERMQIAISMTCPKVQVGAISPANLDFGNSSKDLDFEAMDEVTVAQTSFAPAEVTEEELKNVIDLMERLGL